ncbi:GntR family transcriptional regulator [Streptococcus hillyeri]|uniref:GntR family transcriptional regulator n=1 Tax=Streptococcus hillyeri TaxID=2282420 RepID=A0A3L9DSZ9_9STRE|nr:GntR family transcriptional regulator [Streptococcus hillyeri]RLY03123.1 GntR family transcriptional regulator [Streptococcus hillyeri]
MKPKYQMIADDIRDKIIQKQFLEDSPIPTEIEFQKIYNVSRPTIRQALALLVNEDYLFKKRGAGTFINNRRFFKNSTKTIGVITTYISEYIFPSIIRGIEEELASLGYSLILSSTNNDFNQEKKCIEKMIASNVDGLIIEPTKSNLFNPNLSSYVTLREHNIPIVMINSTYEELDIPYYGIDDIEMCYSSTLELINNGHKNLLLITKIDDLQGKYRMKGFIKACEKHNISLTSSSIITYTTENRYDISDMVLNSITINPKISGIICYNDFVAKKLITFLTQKGYSIPDDYSVVGHDNFYDDQHEKISLTTFNHPKEKLGKDVSKAIIDAIKTGKMPSNKLYSPIISRGNSVKKISS